MPITFHPEPGTILLCDYSTGFIEPEMVKRRPIVVISPKLKSRDFLCAVVPLSTTKPNQIEPYHYELILERPLPHPFSEPVMWAKCDLVSTVSYARLGRFKAGRQQNSHKRKYIAPRISKEQLQLIQMAVLQGLGLSYLKLTP